MTSKTPKLPTYVEPYKYDDSMEFEYEPEKPVYGPDISSSGIIGQVRRAYRDHPANREVNVDGTRHLKFHSYWYKPENDNLGVALSYMGPYNNFESTAAYKALERLPEGARVALGREGSPVIYVAVRACDVREALDAFVSLNVNKQRSPRFEPHGPDELGVTVGTEIYPTSGRYKAPDDIETGTSYWADSRAHYGKIGRYITLPNGQEVRAYYNDLHPPERTDETALIRAWWD